MIDAALAPIAKCQDPRTIKALLLMLNDDGEDDGMWSLVHASEQFSDAVYVDQFLEVLPNLIVSSGRWASILMMRILNHDSTRAEVVRQLQNAPQEARRSATWLCERINEVDPRFLAKTAPVVVAAQS